MMTEKTSQGDWADLLEHVLSSLASRPPHSAVPETLVAQEIDRVSHYILICCIRDKRFGDVAENWRRGDVSIRDDMWSTVREILLTSSFAYMGNTPTISYLVAASAHPLRRLCRERPWLAADKASIQEPVASDQTELTDSQVVIDGLCTAEDIGTRKFVVICLLADAAGFNHATILRILTGEDLPISGEEWARIRGDLPLPDWPTIHSWFLVGPPALRIAALQQFLSRYRLRFRNLH